VSPVALSMALKMEAIPLRASTSVNWYWSRRSPTLASRIRTPFPGNSWGHLECRSAKKQIQTLPAWGALG
jgi:hypothetical protein